MSRSTSIRLVVVLVLGWSVASGALAWNASGTFQYKHRTWDSTGFHGETVMPVRYADVQIINPQGNTLLASGKTDVNGNYSISVSVSANKVMAKVFASTTATPDLKVQVTTYNSAVYSVDSATVNHSGTNDAPIPTRTILPSVDDRRELGDVFNILDLSIYGADYIQYLTGSRPSVLLSWRWAYNGGFNSNTNLGDIIKLRDSAGYDDATLLHEWAHHIMLHYSSSYGGAPHTLTDCNEDQLLAFDEGRASAFGAFVRRHFNMPNANWYIRTDGASDPGTVVAKYDLENVIEASPCTGDTHEIPVSRSLWDIGDGASTTDDSPGVEDTPPDYIALDDSEPWEVFTTLYPMTTATSESFWDGWFNPPVGNLYKTEMKLIFSAQGIEFFPDAYEPNDTLITARSIAVNSGPLHNTYFADPDANGSGQIDYDYFRFTGVAGGLYTIQTSNPTSGAITNLELLDAGGTPVTASNPTQISWTATASATYVIRSTNAATLGHYGSYDLTLTGPPPCGTTDCQHTFCIDGNGGSQLCHQESDAVCSGNVDTGLSVCTDGTTLRTCTGGQHVHTQTCPCVCLGSSCGTHVTFKDCE